MSCSKFLVKSRATNLSLGSSGVFNASQKYYICPVDYYEEHWDDQTVVLDAEEIKQKIAKLRDIVRQQVEFYGKDYACEAFDTLEKCFVISEEPSDEGFVAGEINPDKGAEISTDYSFDITVDADGDAIIRIYHKSDDKNYAEIMLRTHHQTRSHLFPPHD